MRNFYSVLGVTKDATDTEIKKAYRKLALSFHPDKCSTPFGKNSEKEKSIRVQQFQAIAEAYAVLKSPQQKAKYDEIKEEGEDGIDNDSTKDGNEDCCKYDSNEKFQSFFTHEKFRSMGFHDTEDLHSHGQKNGQHEGREKDAEAEKPEPQEIPLMCSLEEIHMGVEKVVKVTRKRSLESGHEHGRISEEFKTLNVRVDPGVLTGTKLIFKGEGDCIQKVKGKDSKILASADIIFVVTEEPHERFHREGQNLILRQRVSLREALAECIVVKVCTLETIPTNRTLRISCPEMIRPGYERIIAGEGMPTMRDPTLRGDLIIRFEIDFPEVLSMKVKEQLQDIL